MENLVIIIAATVVMGLLKIMYLVHNNLKLRNRFLRYELGDEEFCENDVKVKVIRK